MRHAEISFHRPGAAENAGEEMGGRELLEPPRKYDRHFATHDAEREASSEAHAEDFTRPFVERNFFPVRRHHFLPNVVQFLGGYFPGDAACVVECSEIGINFVSVLSKSWGGNSMTPEDFPDGIICHRQVVQERSVPVQEQTRESHEIFSCKLGFRKSRNV